MAEQILVACAAVHVEDEQKLERKRLLRELSDDSDPFSMQEIVFIQNFRFPKSLCHELMEELQPRDLQKSTIPCMVRFLGCLYFYAHGPYQKCVGNNFQIAMSQPSVSRAVHHISKLITDVKGSEIKFPKTFNKISDVKKGFYTAFKIKGTIGAVDCTHIGIVTSPSTDPSNPLCTYMNRKGFYSINVEVVCDHRLLFTALNARFPGSCHVSGMWTTSPTRIHLLRSHNSQCDNWLLGDQGYPLEPWLLTPVAESSNTKEVKYNTIESAFGVLKSHFRRLAKHRTLHYSHERAGNIVYACAILHNILLKHGVAADLGFEALNELEEDVSSKLRKTII